ncbi:MAG: amidophosphoribosyltransferase, partial [Verrucomicrobiota bacterium]
LTNRGMQTLIPEVYQACKAELEKPDTEMVNAMKAIYEPFTAEEISESISALVYPEDIAWKGDVEVIYLGVDELHEAIPVHNGDWYFTGNYPTPGGNRVANQAFVSYVDGDTSRPYDMLGV